MIVNALGSGVMILWAASTLFGDGSPGQSVAVAHWRPSGELLVSGSLPEQRHFNLAQAQARPLFRKTRRPFVPTPEGERNAPEVPPAAAEVPEPPSYDPSRLVLMGVWRLGNETKALIGSDESPEGVWLEAGAMIHGWTIGELDPDGATLLSGKTDYRLKLYVDNSPN